MTPHQRHLANNAQPSERASGTERVMVWVALALCCCAAWYAVAQVAIMVLRWVMR